MEVILRVLIFNGCGRSRAARWTRNIIIKEERIMMTGPGYYAGVIGSK
jgi:hypothetical protein